MNPGTKILLRALELGHANNPAFPVELTEEDAGKVNLTHKEAQAVIRSYQEFMAADLDRLTFKYHRRPAVIDGDVGPATYDLFAMPRCGHPDYLPAGLEEANWPTACRGELKFGRVFENLPGTTKEETDKIWWAVCNNWTQALDDVDMFSHGFVESIEDLNIWAGLKRLSGSTLAWSYLAQNSCSVRLQQAYNLAVKDWGRLAFSAAVGTHEVGHALGLPHNRDRDALMYPSIHQGSIGRRGYPNDTDLQGCESIGYTLSGLDQLPDDQLWYPRNDDDGPEPPPPWGDDDGSPLAVHGKIYLTKDGNVVKSYTLREDA